MYNLYTTTYIIWPYYYHEFDRANARKNCRAETVLTAFTRPNTKCIQRPNEYQQLSLKRLCTGLSFFFNIFINYFIILILSILNSPALLSSVKN